MPRRFVPLVLVLACYFYGSSVPTEAATAPALLGQVSDSNINELSGLAASRRYPGCYWVNNDSGDTARLFLLNGQGQTVATVNFAGVEARDWEDVALAGGWLYAGDIGDNFSVMESIQIHRIHEPTLNPKKLNQQITVPATQIESMTLRYPDGPHDAETLAVTPDSHVLVVSKSEAGSGFYVLNQPFQIGSSALTKIAPFSFGATGWLTKLATGGDLSSDGRKLAITTYSQVYEFPLGTPYDWRSIKYNEAKIQTLPSLKQCESICYTIDGKTLLVSSEGKHPPLYRLESQISNP